jgi:murein DD-endopeptidase MepM/ murein hydrolase activator NlpD
VSFAISSFAFAETNTIEVKNISPVRVGDAVLLQINLRTENIESVTFANKKILPFRYKDRTLAVVAVPGRESSGTRMIKISTRDGQKFEQDIYVGRRNVHVINLPVPEQLNNTPKELVQNLTTQKAEITTVVTKTDDPILVSRPFGLPLSDNRTITSTYGEIRKTGDESIRHLGTDFVLKRGSSVYAINDGIVAKAYLDPTYGNTIIIDHGARINSLYMHLDSMTVKAGERIKQAQRIGTLGKTGYASAAHLHLSIKIDGESVDPLSFIKNFK